MGIFIYLNSILVSNMSVLELIVASIYIFSPIWCPNRYGFTMFRRLNYRYIFSLVEDVE